MANKAALPKPAITPAFATGAPRPAIRGTWNTSDMISTSPATRRGGDERSGTDIARTTSACHAARRQNGRFPLPLRAQSADPMNGPSRPRIQWAVATLYLNDRRWRVSDAEDVDPQLGSRQRSLPSFGIAGGRASVCPPIGRALGKASSCIFNHLRPTSGISPAERKRSRRSQYVGAAVGEAVCAALLRSTQTSRRIAPGLDEATINDFALRDAIDDAILVCLVS